MANGDQEKEIIYKKGLRQGDLLSLLLSVLVVEGPNLLFAHMKAAYKIEGLPTARSVTFTNLAYADDTIIFKHCNILQACAIKWILNCFEAWSGLRIDYHKNSLALTGQVNITSKLIVQIFGCKESNFPILYLEIPIGPSKIKKLVWDPVIKRVNKRLDRWKGKVLSLVEN